MTARPQRRRSVRTAVLAAVAGTLVACGGGDVPAPDAGTTSSRLAGEELWLNPEGHAPVAVEQAQAEGRADDAEVLAPLAEQPTATWIATPDNPYPAVLEISEAAAAAGELPVLVAYNVPGRDCGLYSAGGAADVDAYLAWVGAFAAALGDRPAVVVLEPDAVPQAVVGCEGLDPAARYGLLAQAVDILDRQPGTRVYLDAGNASWVTDLPVLADALRRSGVDRTDGFSVNVSNYETTEVSAEYGLALSEELEAGAPEGTPPPHFVIDTSRNGAGPPEEAAGAEGRWCNPPGRELGQPPTTSPVLPRVDALLWVKQPGDSDGTCAGGPPAGQWWPEMAADLVPDAG
ncbi:glycoside hydrolase family 6 protein [Geodermatophilus sp. DSM 44513]|uniref:glycoside hydrolase family 6 protein n=1 Tax=Geodermatophilus sp. DSM 44513 TaxID=1528104 RepID=UPI00127D2779|nr:glycoside hydrolase family 6 protein [Geodermatophilus sp. DSM 44513]WNV76657.1 glycoside hydrolase family 6 protein [Geodermatophilus sp. DSM 44513]